MTLFLASSCCSRVVVMIEADRQELEANLKLLTLQIREKELAVFTQNFSVLATQASLLAGLGYSGLTMTPVWAKSGASLNASCAFMGLASLGVGFNILTLTVSPWAMIQGTHLAIAGPDGSINVSRGGRHAHGAQVGNSLLLVGAYESHAVRDCARLAQISEQHSVCAQLRRRLPE